MAGWTARGGSPSTPPTRTPVLTARHAVAICTGSTAARPRPARRRRGPPVDQPRGHRGAKRPRRLAVVGGGGVGVEMATAWQGLGSQVTLLVRGPALLPRMEPFAGELVAEA